MIVGKQTTEEVDKVRSMVTFSAEAISHPRGGSLRKAMEATRTSFAKWRIYRATLEEFRNLSDRELADLGIARSALRRIAADAVQDRGGQGTLKDWSR